MRAVHLIAAALAYWYWDGVGVRTPATVIIDGNLQVALNTFSRNMAYTGIAGAVGTFGACNAANPNIGGTRGVTLYDTNTNTMLYCDGTTWREYGSRFDATDSSGTPGAATINKSRGQSAIAAAASTVVITNSFVTTTSVVDADLQFNDATCTAVKSVIPAAGSFTVTLNANCTAATKVGWVVFN